MSHRALTWSIFSFAALACLVACSGEEFSSGKEGGGTPPAGSGGTGEQAGSSAGGTAGGNSGGGIGGSGGGGGNSGANPGGSAGSGGAQGGAGGSDPAGQPCELGTFACSNNTLLTCSAQTKTFTPIDTCADDGFCDATAGDCKVCKPGAMLGCADPFTRTLCQDDGTPGKKETCPEATPLCNSKGTCVECIADGDCPALPEGNECFLPRCLENTCSKEPSPQGTKTEQQPEGGCLERLCDGQGKTTESPLAVGTTCNEGKGVCNGKGGCGECIPGAKECVGSDGFRVCSEEGLWQTPQVCSDKPVCDAGACQGVQQMITGVFYSCALLESGNLRCWGSLTGQYPAEKFQGGFSNITQISGGQGYAFCALNKDGEVLCAGLNAHGEFGNGQKNSLSEPMTEPVKVKAEFKFRHISVGFDFACGVSQSNQTYCWGNNQSYQLGYKPPTSAQNPAPQVEALLPQKVQGLPDIQELDGNFSAGGQHACAAVNGNLFCWGDGAETGLNPPAGGTPAAKLTLSSQKIPLRVFAGDGNTIGLFADLDSNLKPINHQIKLWGYNPLTKSTPTSPTQILAGNDAKNLVHFASTSDIIAATFSNGHVLVAGRNIEGVVGTGEKSDTIKTLVHIDEPRDGVAVSTTHMCAWKTGGRAWCWGKNHFGQTGTGLSSTHVLKPTPVKW